MGKKNVFEDIVSVSLERNLSLRFDICTCDKCRESMFLRLLGKFPPHYADEDDPRYKEVEREIFREFFRQVFEETNKVVKEVSQNMPHLLTEDRGRAFERLLEKIKEDRGIDFTQYRHNILKRRIVSRLLAHNVKSYTEYLGVLKRVPDEYEKLYNALTINVSLFFRDPPVWRGIRTILKQVIKKCNEENEPVRIWSAGCAAGQEPYSLAILSREIESLEVPLIIYATDVDAESLNIARKGDYESKMMKKTLEDLSTRHFIIDFQKYFDVREGIFHVTDEIKKRVEFRYLDLTSGDSIGDVHIVLCRNVFIYFSKTLQERIVDKFYNALKEDGYFIIGNTETLVSEARIIFREIDAMKRIYQKLSSA